jgi:transcriptional regulator with XRE-family HTH domain
MDDETKEVIARAELPKTFRDIRMALGLSQEKMAELSGISRVQISYYETADTVPTMGTFNKWLSATTKEIRRIRENKWGRNATQAQDKHGLIQDKGIQTSPTSLVSQNKGTQAEGEG